jgi:hypothetical protein
MRVRRAFYQLNCLSVFPHVDLLEIMRMLTESDQMTGKADLTTTSTFRVGAILTPQYPSFPFTTP